MFTYLRYFSAISFVVVVAAAILVGVYFRHTAADDLKMVVEQNNVSLAQGFNNTVWRRYRRLFTEILAGSDVKQWPQDKYFVQFSREAFRYFESIPIAKINIYTAGGERFLSTDQSEIILFQTESSFLFGGKKDESSDSAALEAVKSGKVFSRIVPEGGFKGADGNMRRGSLVQTYIPILSDSYVPVVMDNSTPKIEGFMEVFFDITPQYRQLDQFQIVGTSGIIIIFITLFAALILTARRAETIIAKQHDKTLELTAAKARAEAENMEKSRFLANISHELRTPLNAIIGFSEIVKTQSLGPINNSQYVEYVADIHSSGVHLLSLINDILDYSKAEAGKLELEISELDAKKLVRTCLRLVQTRAEEAKVNLVENVPKEHFVLNTDAKKLKQVLLNLLSNAVKFTPENGTVSVTAWHNVLDDTYSIEVKDTGIGIAPKDISKAMSPFGQVDSELSRKYEGTGLGLPLTKKFTEIMGGTFAIQSELNVGTTITITLPKFPPANAIKRGSNVSGTPQAAEVTTAKSFTNPSPKPAIEPPAKTELPAAIPSAQNKIVAEGERLSPQPASVKSSPSHDATAMTVNPFTGSAPIPSITPEPMPTPPPKPTEPPPPMVTPNPFAQAPAIPPAPPKPDIATPPAMPAPTPNPFAGAAITTPQPSVFKPAPMATPNPFAEAATTTPQPPVFKPAPIPPAPMVTPNPFAQTPAIPPAPPKPDIATPPAMPAPTPNPFTGAATATPQPPVFKPTPIPPAPMATPNPFAQTPTIPPLPPKPDIATPPAISATTPNPFAGAATATPQPPVFKPAPIPPAPMATPNPFAQAQAIPPLPPKPAVAASPAVPMPNPFAQAPVAPPPQPALQPVYPQAAIISPTPKPELALAPQPPLSAKPELSLATQPAVGQSATPAAKPPEDSQA